MPQLPDTRIALSGLGGGGGGDRQLGPLGTLGALMQIKEQQSIMRQRQLQAEKLQRDQEEDEKINIAMRYGERPEDGIAMLAKSGDWNAASKASTMRAAQLKAQGERDDALLKTNATRYEQAGAWMQALLDANKKGDPTVGAMFNNIRPMIVNALRPAAGDAVEDLVGTTFNPERIGALANGTLTRAQQLAKEREAKDRLVRAATDGQIGNPFMSPGNDANGNPLPAPIDAQGAEVGEKWSANALKVLAEKTDVYKKHVGDLIGLSRNRDEWVAHMDYLHQTGVPQPFIDSAPKWDDYATPEEFQKAVVDYSRTQKDKDALAKEADRIRHEKEGERVAGENLKVNQWRARVYAETAGGAGGAKPITTAQQLAADRSRNSRNIALEEKYKTDLAKAVDADARKVVRAAHIEEKLRIENIHRNESRELPFEDAAYDAIGRGDRADYDRLVTKYNGITEGTKDLRQLVPWVDDGETATPEAGGVGGAVDRFLGGAVSTLFGKPGAKAAAADEPEPETAVALQARIDDLKAQLREATDPAVRVALKAKLRKLR